MSREREATAGFATFQIRCGLSLELGAGPQLTWVRAADSSVLDLEEGATHFILAAEGEVTVEAVGRQNADVHRG